MNDFNIMGEHIQDNVKENFEHQETQKVIEETRGRLKSLESEILNNQNSPETRGWDIEELNKASKLIGDFFEIRKIGNPGENKEKVVFNMNSILSYLKVLHKRLSVSGAPSYSEISKEKIFGSTILAIQIALESINRTAPQIGFYDVGAINGKLNPTTQKAIEDFQRDHKLQVDGKPGKGTIAAIIKELEGKDTYNTYNLMSFSSTELIERLKAESSVDFAKYGTSKAVRTNNPGNIHDKKDPSTGQYLPGCIGYEGNFSVFETPLAGRNALVWKIKNMQNGGSKVYKPNFTLSQYFKKYDPTNPRYAGEVAKMLKVPLNTQVGKLDPEKFACAISQKEDGSMYKKLVDKGIITNQILQKNSLRA